MAIGPPTGMRDWLPRETLLRQRLMETIGSVYRQYGYLPIDTPAMEDLDVLLGKGGGENEKLLFKVLKRGEKLEQARQSGDLADYGLRYDLTVPLARFVATHQGELPRIFRRYHIGPVWRADRPQSGRYREFYQCDIDVVGGASPAYECEIITATERVLAALELGRYRFRLSDKRLLPLLLHGFGVTKEQIGPITIALDKLDKVGIAQVVADIVRLLGESPKTASQVEAFIGKASDVREKDPGRHATVESFRGLWEKIDAKPALRADMDAVLSNLAGILDAVRAVNPASVITFDPILVRGMDYYTGPIYEAVVDGFSSSILGGGRYDGLIGQISGKPVPAVGCSIGFERLLAILQERAGDLGKAVVTRVLLLHQENDDPVHLQRQAEQLRSEGIAVEAYLEPDPLGKQLKHAEREGMLWAVKRIDSPGSGLVVRHLPTRDDRTMSLAEFKTVLKRP